MKQLKLISFFLLALLITAGCKKKKPSEDTSRTPFVQGESVFILNEGEFQTGNGTITHYNKITDSVENGVFKKVNGDNLGDIVQSMSIIDGKGYIVVNNSQKVEVVGLDSLLRQGMINGLTSPRYIFKVGASKAYISELFGDSVAVVDLQNELITRKIGIPGWTGEMAQNQNHVFIANNADEYVYVVDPMNDSVVDKIELIASSKSLAWDSEGNLWVLCSGSSSNNIPARLFKIDPINFSKTQDFTFTGSSASDLHTNAAGDKLYFLYNGVYEMATSAQALPTNPLIAANGRVLYALGIDPDNRNGEIYIGDAGNFSNDGMVYRYTPQGSVIDSFKVGIAPGYIQFY